MCAILEAQDAAGRLIGAICAAPLVLEKHGIGAECVITSHPSLRQSLLDSGEFRTLQECAGRQYSDDNLVVSNNIVTSRGPGTAIDFVLKIVELLVDKPKAEEIAKRIVHRYIDSDPEDYEYYT